MATVRFLASSCQSLISSSRALKVQGAVLEQARRGYAVKCSIVSGETFTSMSDLVARLQERQIIKTPAVAAVMMQLDRATFANTYTGVPKSVAYMDGQIPIGQSQNMSAPSMHATAMELLYSHLTRPKPRVLDVGTGGGYLAAAFGVLSGEGSTVIGIDKHKRLVEAAYRNIMTIAPELLDPTRIGNVDLLTGNVLQAGMLADFPPFDVIHVGAAIEEIPQVLVDALAPGGRMVIAVGPVTGVIQKLMSVDKAADGSVTMTHEAGVKLPPLTYPAADQVW